MNNDNYKKSTTIAQDMGHIDYETITNGNKTVEKANSRLQDVLKKLSRTKELCSKENLYIQGMSMEQTFEDYYRDLKMLVQDLEDLTEKINKAIYKAQIREQSIVPSNGGVRQ